ncbi:MAG: hypothetical protein FWE93_02840 [Alphaproteobacteria bacterium]|nr:hypothetical protein [Alphaproteobacteria bacterium]
MSIDITLLKKAFSPKTVLRAVATFDKSMLVIIASCWLCAIVAMGLATFAINGVVEWKSRTDKAILSEPIIPVMKSTPVGTRELADIEDRLRRQFPSISISRTTQGGGMLVIKADKGELYQQWITAISYVDSIAGQYKWELKEFCVGACTGGKGLMYAALSGYKVTIEKAK